MSDDPPGRDEDIAHRRALADVIERRAPAILQRWLELVTDDTTARHVSPTELRDALDEYLRRLAVALRGSAALDEAGRRAWGEVAQAHAVTRVRLGFDVAQLIREFALLRRVLLRVVREVSPALAEASAELITELIEAAVEISVTTYVEARDFEVRQAQARHVSFATHELKNPLSTALLAAAALKRTPPPTAAAARALERLERSLHQLRELVDGVLTVERFEAGATRARAEWTTLGAIMERALTLARQEAARKGLRFTARFDPQASIRVDPDLTVSAIQNLADNAVKFTDAGEVEVSVEQRDGELIVHVRDMCGGLSELELPTIFEPFRRAHTTKPGSGLGLSIARRAAEAQGGTIEVETRGNVGCHFWLTLPRELW